MLRVTHLPHPDNYQDPENESCNHPHYDFIGLSRPRERRSQEWVMNLFYVQILRFFFEELSADKKSKGTLL